MKKQQNFLLFLSLFLLLAVLIINFSAEKVPGKIPESTTKRGYIFDRNLNPLAVSLENYKAYYCFKKSSFFGSSDLKILQKYLGSTINLDKKDIILLSENLSLEEVENLKNEKSVIIEISYKRKVLFPYLKTLIGETSDEHGISGLEKIFDKELSMGKPLILSIDLKLEKKLYNLIRNFSFFTPDSSLLYASAIFDLQTGELLGYLESESAYLESESTQLYSRYYPIKLFGIPSHEVKTFKWTLGENPILKEGDTIKINIWHLAKWYMDKVCNSSLSPTLLYSQTKVCEPNLEIFEKDKYFYDLGDTFLIVTFKKDKLILFSLTFNSQQDNLTEEKQKIDKEKLSKKVVNYILAYL